MTVGPMMRCGHAANGYTLRDGERIPVCVIHSGLTPDAAIVDDSPPDLTTRTARCGYYGKTPKGRNNEGPCRGGECRCERPSSDPLPFFEHRPDAAHDLFYCGCWGWD